MPTVVEDEAHLLMQDQGRVPASYEKREGAAGYFGVGTYANSVLAALTYSLPYIQKLGVDKIQKHAAELNEAVGGDASAGLRVPYAGRGGWGDRWVCREG